MPHAREVPGLPTSAASELSADIHMNWWHKHTHASAAPLFPRSSQEQKRERRVRLLVRLTRLSRGLHRKCAALEALAGPSAPPPLCSATDECDIHELLGHMPQMSEPDVADSADAVLLALENGAPLPSATASQHAGLAAVTRDVAFKGTQRVDTNCLKRLRAFCGNTEIEEALKRCRCNDADDDHWTGEDGAMMRRIAKGAALIEVVLDRRPLSPVALFTPLSEHAYAAVASERIAAGQPFCQYAGELIREDDPVPESNSYLYELDAYELKERGYSGMGLRINGREKGGVARFINDNSTVAARLPPRRRDRSVERTGDSEARPATAAEHARGCRPKSTARLG